MSENLLQKAKQIFVLIDLMRLLGITAQLGKNIICPFHDDRRPSLSLFVGDAGEQLWKCHGCGRSGDAVDFLAEFKKLSNSEACREYIKLAGVAPDPAPARSHETTFDWEACVAAFKPDHKVELAQWRGYEPATVEWLHQQRLIGLFQGRHVAFPVHDVQGNVVACHWRNKEENSWRYYPGGQRVAPMIIGELKPGCIIHLFESQWDGFALIDKLGWAKKWLEGNVVIATRGAANGRLIARLCPEGASVYFYPQNDKPKDDGKTPPGEQWMQDAVRHCAAEKYRVKIPREFKDLNEWTRAGANSTEVFNRIGDAERVDPVADSTKPELTADSLEEGDDDPTDPEPFPTTALPLPLRNMVTGVSASQRVPESLPAVCAISLVSAALGPGLEIESGANRLTRGNTYIIASAESGSGKSETFRLIARPMLTHQAQLSRQWKEERASEIEAHLKVLEKQIADGEKRAAKVKYDAERDELISELQGKIAQKQQIERQVTSPAIMVQDATIERMAVLLEENNETLFSASSDGRKLIDNILGRYAPNKSSDESLYLSAYSGDMVRVDRQGRDSITLHRPCLTLCWLIQPDLLNRMLEKDSLSASGFLPRVLVCHTDAVPQKIGDESPPLAPEIIEQWDKLIDNLIVTYHNAPEPLQFQPTPEAKNYLDDFFNEVVDRRRDDLADVGIFAARYGENAWRLAVVLHAAQFGNTAHVREMTLETAQNAVCIVRWFIGQQLSVLAKSRLEAAQKLENEVLELLASNKQRKGLDYITARDVQRARIAQETGAANHLLARMEAEGLLIGQDHIPVGGGRRTRRYSAILG